MTHDDAKVEFLQSLELLQFLRMKEGAPPAPNCLEFHQQLAPWMRTVLVDWIHELYQRFAQAWETFFLAVNILDRYLAERARQGRSISLSGEFQCIGAACFLIAHKYEEVYPISASEIIHDAGRCFTRGALLATERDILDTLHFRMEVVTPAHFFSAFRCPWGAGHAWSLGTFLLKLAMLYVDIGTAHRPSMIAGAALYLALWIRGEEWTKRHEELTQYTAAELNACCKQLYEMAVRARAGVPREVKFFGTSKNASFVVDIEKHCLHVAAVAAAGGATEIDMS